MQFFFVRMLIAASHFVLKERKGRERNFKYAILNMKERNDCRREERKLRSLLACNNHLPLFGVASRNDFEIGYLYLNN